MRFARILGPAGLVALAGCSGPTDHGEVGSPARIRLVASVPASALVGNFVPTPAFRVEDQQGRPVPGVEVAFSAAAGLVARESATTGSDGVATPGAWRLGPTVGVQRLSAAAADVAAEVAVQAVVPPVGGYRIQVVFAGTGYGQVEVDLVREAVARWESIILGDLPDVTVGAATFGCPLMLVYQGALVDDLLLFVNWTTLPQGTVAKSLVCQTRPGSGLPSVANIQIDRQSAAGTVGIYQTMLHEIGHALGIGTTWDHLLREVGGDLRFTGPMARAAYLLALGTADAGGRDGVPVEMTGPASIARAHWRESRLTQELMTPFSETVQGTPRPSPLSAITVNALRDLGYLVDDRLAEPFPMP